jgi:replication factor C subunit 2/4
MNNLPWVDKYRPRRIHMLSGQEHIKKILENTLKTGDLPHLLLYGPPGTGKTSTIFALAYELFGPNLINDRVLELNASDERGIDTVRDKIISFAKESIGTPDPAYPSPPYKIIILDEADAITLEAQSALRKVIETSSRITRFCFTCNYIEKIIDPIISRCVKFRFKLIESESMKHKLKIICLNENMSIKDDCLDRICEISQGDARRAIIILQNLKYIYKNYLRQNKFLSIEDIDRSQGITPNKILEEIYHIVVNSSIKELNRVTKNILNQSINLCELILFLKNKILESKLIDSEKSFLILSLIEIESRLYERGDEYLNLLYLLSNINLKLKNKLIIKK